MRHAMPGMAQSGTDCPVIYPNFRWHDHASINTVACSATPRHRSTHGCHAHDAAGTTDFPHLATRQDDTSQCQAPAWLKSAGTKKAHEPPNRDPEAGFVAPADDMNKADSPDPFNRWVATLAA
ncbi:hypothetical protein [Burkholderia glumae]|uniref:hypothetical protein n=1 Tax=Burkholderia glumae TaxID=337 RepID=UPI0014644254|nr:hypothetical protein [Burkholderia glumae]QJP68864.1 hypothetical protein HJC54_08380 [Burkholderia glumae]